MTKREIMELIYNGASELINRRLRYISGQNVVTIQAVDSGLGEIRARRGQSDFITINTNHLETMAENLSPGEPVSLEAVFQGSGNTRSALETILAHLPHVGYLPANSRINRGPKKLIWFNEPKHEIGVTFDGTDAYENESPPLTQGTTIINRSMIVEYAELLRSQVGLRLTERSLVSFVSSALSKRLMIIAGLSGSGKTLSAKALAAWLATDDSYALVPVGADWTGSENILGYPDGLDADRYVSTPTLELIMNACEQPEVPHFLILDEMNLSHVERYFADLLSAMESGEAIPLYEGDGRATGDRTIPNAVRLPENLFIIGTVNVDETTYMFSPKVLDRANVIEFRMDEEDLAGFLGNPARPTLSRLEGRGAAHGKAFVEAAKSQVSVPAEVAEAYKTEMLALFDLLRDHGAEYGYRVAYEAARFVHFYKLLSGAEDGNTAWFNGAMDCVIVQKLLPKLHGSQTKLKPLLLALWRHCVGDPTSEQPTPEIPEAAPYKLSAEKVHRMWRLLHENGFASFAEA